MLDEDDTATIGRIPGGDSPAKTRRGFENRRDRLRLQAGADAGVRGLPRSDVHVPPAGDHP